MAARKVGISVTGIMKLSFFVTGQIGMKFGKMLIGVFY